MTLSDKFSSGVLVAVMPATQRPSASRSFSHKVPLVRLSCSSLARRGYGRIGTRMTFRNNTPTARSGTRWNSWTAVCVVSWILVAVRYGHMIPRLPSRAKAYDFSLYYTSGLALSKGLDPYRTNLVDLGRRRGYSISFDFHC